MFKKHNNNSKSKYASSRKTSSESADTHHNTYHKSAAASTHDLNYTAYASKSRFKSQDRHDKTYSQTEVRPVKNLFSSHSQASESQRVQKIICNAGLCSRRQAEEFIKDGKVRVNGKVIHIGDKAYETDKIEVSGRLLRGAQKLYLMLNKPVGCVTSLSDPQYKTVMIYVKIKERVFPIGRLDFNTSGLLLLTNDGDFANRIMHPRYEIKKTYVVKTNREIRNDQVIRLEHGIDLEDGRTRPAKVVKLDIDLLEITIHEGKKRVVRRMLESLGFRVMGLERIKIGDLYLGDLRPGKFRHLQPYELDLIFRK